MAINLIESPLLLEPQPAPNHVNAVEAPISWAWASDTSGYGSGARADLWLRLLNVTPFSNAAPDGATLTVNGKTIVFRDNPGPGEVIASSAPSAPTLAQIVDGVYLQLRDDPTLNVSYSILLVPIFTGGNAIRIQARETGSEFTLSWSQSVDNNFVAFSQQAGADFCEAQELNNYAIWVDVFIDESNLNRFFLQPFAIDFLNSEWVLLERIRKDFVRENAFRFDLREVLAPMPRSLPPEFSASGTRFEPVQRYIRRYALSVGEEWTDENGKLRRETRLQYGFGSLQLFIPPDWDTANLWVVNASRPRPESGNEAYVNFRDWWLREPGETVNFLNNLPEVKRIDRRSIEYLHLLYARSGDSYDHLQVEVDFEMEDCTQENGVIPVNLTRPNPGPLPLGSCYAVEVSPRLLQPYWDDIEATYGSRIKQYTVQVFEYSPVAPRLAVSQKQTYRIHYADEFAPLVYQLLFLNPLGGYDSIFGWGKTEKRVRGRLSENERTLLHEPAPRIGGTYTNPAELSERGNYAAEGEVTYTFLSGYYPRDHVNWLRGATVATEIYLLSEADPDLSPTAWRRVTAENINLRYRPEPDDYVQVELELRLGYDLNYVRS